MTVMINDMVVADEKVREDRNRPATSDRLWVATQVLCAIISSTRATLDEQVPLALRYADELIAAAEEPRD